MQRDCDAVIVGAGPAGSVAATLLARAGWRVALIERQRFPRRKVCGECIAASNLPLLAALGLGPAFEAAAGPELREVGLWRGERELLAPLPAAPHERYAWGRALGRETLDTLLLAQARAAGATVWQPWAVQALRGRPGDWRCELREAESGSTLTLRAPVAIAAHGSWETLPSERPQRRQSRSAADLFAFKANFSGASLPEGLLPVLALDGGYGGMVRAGGGIVTLACCIRSDRLDGLRRATPGARAGDAVGAWLQRECGGVRRALHSATRDGPWLAAGPIAPGIRLGLESGGPFRIGNAAGEAHPILGEGIGMALQSAVMLAATLLAAPGIGTAAGKGAAADAVPGPARQAEIERAFAAEWRRQFAPRLRLAAAFAHVAMRPAPGALLMALAGAWPGLLTQGARWGGKLRCAADLAHLAPRAQPALPTTPAHTPPSAPAQSHRPGVPT